MLNPQNSRRNFLLAIAAAGTSFAAGQMFAQDAKLKEPVYRVATKVNNVLIAEAAEGEHPLDPALKFAEDGLRRIQKDRQSVV